MHVRSLVLALTAVFGGLSLLHAQETLPSLEGIKWAGAAVTPKTLQGKTVILLVYAKWCPKANVWSGELFQQLKEAIKDRPVVLLAINADSSPSGVTQYISKRNFFAPNILHGYDPLIAKRLNLDNNRFEFFVYGPDGILVDQGYAGASFKVGLVKTYALPAALKKNENLGHFLLLDPNMSEPLKKAIWPMELGEFNEKKAAEILGDLDRKDREAFEDALTQCLDDKVKRIASLIEGDSRERFEGYEDASELAAAFRSKPQGKQAKEMLTALLRDKKFQRELTAKKNYEKTLQIIAAKPNRREQLLLAFCKRFEGTYFADIARESVEKARLESDSPQEE